LTPSHRHSSLRMHFSFLAHTVAAPPITALLGYYHLLMPPGDEAGGGPGRGVPRGQGTHAHQAKQHPRRPQGPCAEPCLCRALSVPSPVCAEPCLCRALSVPSPVCAEPFPTVDHLALVNSSSSQHNTPPPPQTGVEQGQRCGTCRRRGHRRTSHGRRGQGVRRRRGCASAGLWRRRQDRQEDPGHVPRGAPGRQLVLGLVG